MMSTRYVRLWHKADMPLALMNVGFEGNNGHDADVMRCLLMTQSKLSTNRVEPLAPLPHVEFCRFDSCHFADRSGWSSKRLAVEPA